MREALCSRFYEHVGRKPNEIFVSDGSKCDIGRLQMMFGSDTTVAVQARPAFCLNCFARLLFHAQQSSTLARHYWVTVLIVYRSESHILHMTIAL